jgi:hypothetical protein
MNEARRDGREEREMKDIDVTDETARSIESYEPLFRYSAAAVVASLRTMRAGFVAAENGPMIEVIDRTAEHFFGAWSNMDFVGRS